MSGRYLIGLDQSTQGTKAVLLDESGKIRGRSFRSHEQIISPEGWVSHDGEEILLRCREVIRSLLQETDVSPDMVAAVGISNQRETTVAWDRETGIPVRKAIVWQCARAKEISDEITDEGFREYVRRKTGIPLSPYFPACKAAWILRHEPKARELADRRRLCIGTIDSWLVFRMTEGRVFRTDYSNASRTQLFDLHTLSWDGEICSRLGIPLHALPEITGSDGDYGATTLDGLFDRPVPLAAVMGDSHAALFGQGCIRPGMAKATYGTGSSVMMNIGETFRASERGLVTSIAWGRGGRVEYVLEGNINYAGAVITWLQKDLGLIERAEDTEALAFRANRSDTSYLVPAFSGLGAPYWKDSARAVLTGMSRTTGKCEIVKAALESIGYQVTAVTEAMGADAGLTLSELRTDGGPTANRYLMQFQSDMAHVKIAVPEARELSAMGAAMMAGIHTGLWDDSILHAIGRQTEYTPEMDENERNRKYSGWKEAVGKA